MIDLAGVGGFAIEACDGGGVPCQRGADHLDGALAAHAAVLGEIHSTHAALANLRDDPVAVGDDLANERIRRFDVAKRRAVIRTEFHGWLELAPANAAGFLGAHLVRVSWPV